MCEESDRRTQSAYHEAGHVVMAWYTGRDIGTVTIERDYDEGTAGFVRHESDVTREPGDLGMWVVETPEHGLIVSENPNDPEPHWRRPTDSERKHIGITDSVTEREDADCRILINAAGEAAARQLTGDKPPPEGW